MCIRDRLYSEWCPHCYQYKPTREKIESHFAKNRKLTIATISCDNDRQLCDQFPGTGTPRLYMTTSTIENAEKFERSRTFEEVKAFIDKYIEPAITQINSKDQLEAKIKENVNSSIFICQDLQGTKLSQIFVRLASNYVSYPAKFLNLTFERYKSNEPLITYYYSPTKVQFSIHATDSQHKIERFIHEHIYPPFGVASTTFFDTQIELKEPFLVIEDLKHQFQGQLIKYSKDFPENVKSIEIDCTEYLKFCKQNGYNPKDHPWIAIVNLNRDTYFHFTGDFTNKKEFLNWVTNVYQGKISEEGPGAGFIGFIKRDVLETLIDYTFWIKVLGLLAITVLIYNLSIAVRKFIALRHRGYHDRRGFRVR